MTTPLQRQARVTRTVRDYRRQLIAREQTAQRQLVASYDAAYDALISELTAAIDNAQRAVDAGNPTINTWRVHRAVELARQAEQLLSDIARQTGETVSQQQTGAARDAFRAAGNLLDAVMGEPPEGFPNASSFMRFPASAIEQLTGSLSAGPVQELLDRYNATGAKEAGRILTGAVANGTHPSLIAEALREQLDTVLWKSARIARTEINRTYRESLRQTMQQNRRIIPKWIWRSARSLSTCSACFPAGTMVSTAGVHKVFSRHYIGDVIVIKTAAGKDLTATPNHPILTSAGWIAAGLLQKGDDVISSTAGERAEAAIDIHDQQMPVRIEQVAATLGMVPTEVECAAPDFHGDGKGSDVYVVWTHGLLGHACDPASHQVSQEGPLGVRSTGMLTPSGTDFEDFCLSDPALDVMDIWPGVVTKYGGAFLQGNTGAAQDATLRHGPASDSGDPQTGGNGRASHIERLCQSEFSLAFEIPSPDLMIRQRHFCMPLRSDSSPDRSGNIRACSEDSAIMQDGEQSLVVDVIPTSDDLRPVAGDVVIDRVLDVSVRRFDGQVFNLQTKTGWYVANGVIVHNCWALDGRLFDVEEPMGTHVGCRCSLEPEPISWDDLAAMHGLTMPAGDWSIPEEPTGPDAFATLSAEDQQRILDPGRKDGATPRWDAFNAGTVELRDFVHTSHSDDWGTTRREAGLAAALDKAGKRKS